MSSSSPPAPIASNPCRIRLDRQYSTSADMTQKQSSKACSFCGAINPLPRTICQACSAPAAIPESVSFYSYFPGLAPPPEGPFTVDLRALRREFLQIQQKVHPDKFTEDDKKRLIAESTSSLINKAYTTLQNPLSRAEYILSCNGVEMSSEGEKLTGGGILMTVMELREQIEEAQTESDLQPVKEEVDGLIKSELDQLEELFGRSSWEDAKNSAVRLRYWFNIQKAAADWEPGSEIRIDH